MDQCEADYFASLLHKLETDQSLSEKDCKYIYTFFQEHSKCSINAVSQSTYNDKSCSCDMLKSTVFGEKTIKNQNNQCAFSTTIDYGELEIMMHKQWSLPVEERNNAAILEISKHLFPYRRPIIKNNELTVRVVLILFPYLFAQDQIFLELELITNKNNLFETFTANVKKFSERIIDHFYHSPEQLSKKILRKIDSVKSKKEKEQYLNSASLLLIPSIVGEDRKSFIIFKKEALNSEQLIYIFCDDDLTNSLKKATFIIYADSFELCSVNTIEEAYFGVLAAHAALNFKYPKNCRNTLCLLEQFYLEFPNASRRLGKKFESKIQLFLKDMTNK